MAFLNGDDKLINIEKEKYKEIKMFYDILEKYWKSEM